MCDVSGLHCLSAFLFILSDSSTYSLNGKIGFAFGFNSVYSIHRKVHLHVMLLH